MFEVRVRYENIKIQCRIHKHEKTNVSTFILVDGVKKTTTCDFTEIVVSSLFTTTNYPAALPLLIAIHFPSPHSHSFSFK